MGYRDWTDSDHVGILSVGDLVEFVPYVKHMKVGRSPSSSGMDFYFNHTVTGEVVRTEIGLVATIEAVVVLSETSNGCLVRYFLVKAEEIKRVWLSPGSGLVPPYANCYKHSDE